MWLLRNKLFLASICILIALFFTFVVTPQYQNYINKSVKVVMLNKNINTNTLIVESMLVNKSVRYSEVPKNAITDKQQVIGKFAKVPIFADDYLSPIKITSKKVEKGYLSGADNNATAVAINMPNLAASLAAQIRPGDVVSIVAYDKRESQVIAPPELQFITVADVINNDGVSVYEQSNKALDIVTSAITAENIIPSSVIFICDIKQSLKLVELANRGQVHIIYRNKSNSFKLGVN